MSDLSLGLVEEAQRSIAGTAVRTPLVPSPYLSAGAGSAVLLKLETAQPTGAFKLRGAANAVFSLAPEVPGVTCCSTGNHGRGVAFAARERGLAAVICMSSLVPATKIEAIEALGAEVRITGRSQDDAAEESRRLAREAGFAEISPFDDPLVVAGQATIGLELLDERPDIATILVPLSGGGLAGGVAFAAKSRKPDIQVIGISMDRGAAMHASIAAGRPVEVVEVESLADSLGGGVGLDNRLSFALCRDLLDDIVLVAEEEIYRGMQALHWEDGIVAEGAAAVGAAALIAGKLPGAPGPVAAVVTGNTVDPGLHAAIVSGKDVVLGDLTIRGVPWRAT